MSELHVVDLASQAKAVARHIKGWERARILAWLATYGEIRTVYTDNPDVFLFRSSAGISTGFILYDNGELGIIGDHSVWVVPGE